MDNFLNIKGFVSYLFFKNRKISIFVEKTNIGLCFLAFLKFVFVFSCPFGIELEFDVDVGGLSVWVIDK